jgi:hypothetical protein
MSQHTEHHLEAMTSAANSIGAEMQKKVDALEAQRDHLLADLRICREAMGLVLAEGHDLSFGTGNALVSAIDISGEAIAKAVQP